jgi:hypothetical protein
VNFNVPQSEGSMWWLHERDGFHMEWRRDDNCRVATVGEYLTRQCRRPKCNGAPVMAMMRGYGQAAHWWLYCAEHLYGRRIENGVVEMPKLVQNEETA